MKKILINISKKTLTASMLFAFLFNANFVVVQSVYAQYDYDYSYTTDYNYDNTDYTNYTNNNVDTVSYGCEYYGSCNTYTNDPVYTYPTTPVYNEPIYTGSPVYNDPIYTNPVYNEPIYTYPTNPIYTYPTNPIYTTPSPVYTYPTPITPVVPTTRIYCSINGYYYNTQSEYNNYCKAPVLNIYCAINGQYYNSQEAYNANCKNVVNLYCALNGQTYNSQQSYADGCKKYCSINGYYYSTQSDFNNYCKAPVVSIYCSINGQYYSSQAAYDANCKNVTTTYYCNINGQTYYNVSDYNNYCKNVQTWYCALNGSTYNSQDAYNTGCRLYCTYNGYYYNTQNEYNNLCKAPISLYCALNGQTYSTNQSYSDGCKKYCSINGYYYTTENEYNNYCKTVTTPTWYCTVNSRTYYSQNDYNNYCRNIVTINHRVVTTVPTQIMQNSAKCNGVAMISNGVNTNGYFEYGTTQSLGYNTNSGNIGNQMSTQYSSLITNLKANTLYYCRAVIVNANGTYKGELMSFRTSSDYVKYIPVVTAPKPKQVVTYVKSKKVVTYVAPKSDKGGIDITCQDVDGNKDIIKSGEKLATVKIEAISNQITKGNVVDYKVTYKNTSELTLSNVIVKITAPKDMTFVDKNVGEYDAIENSITIEDARVRTEETVEKVIKLKVNDNVTAGKSLVLNSYLSYEVLDTKGKTLKDEVTSYVISTVTDETAGSNVKINDNEKSSKSMSVLPSTLLEWVAILALIMILVVLGRIISRDVKGLGTHGNTSH